jgi:hypothetical protein
MPELAKKTLSFNAGEPEETKSRVMTAHEA